MSPLRSILSKLSAMLFMLSALSLFVPAPKAEAASEGPYSMEVIMHGRSMREYYHKGKTYIEARRGQEYSVRLTNNTGERVAVALAVDGLNSIDAKHTSAAAARKWILGPYESIVIDGWQTSSQSARQFYFTNERSSYGAWMGDTRNLGNISAAFFREVRPVPPPWYDDRPVSEYDYNEGEMARESRSARKAAPAAPGAASGAGARAGDAAPQQSLRAKAETSDELAATGIGRERDHRVYTVEFKQESSPVAVMTVRYEFRDKLIQLGVLPRYHRPDPTYRRENSSGFSDYGYAPDPYRN